MVKRLFDIVISALLLVILMPLFLTLAFLILVAMGRPVIFIQERPGLNGQKFSLFKFRTMESMVDAQGALLSDEGRLTALGRFLRCTSLDESPELWNVLKGDMSLVGPRPLLVDYMPLYNLEQVRRHEVQPGITGWAQVNGRNTITWEDKFRLDVWYVDNQSFWLDFKILILTIIKVFRAEGISHLGEATMNKFTGTQR